MLKFIKSYWLHVALIIGAAVYTCIKVANSEWADAIIAVTLGVVAGSALLTRIDYDELYNSHAELVVEYIEELNNNLDFINKSRATLLDIMTSVDGVVNPVTGDVDTIVVSAKPKKKRGRPKKV